MGQVTIYLDNETESRIKKAARASRLSVSKWVAGIINEKTATQWSQDVSELAGSWSDDFPSLPEIRKCLAQDFPREEL